MIVHSLEDARNSGRHVISDGWQSTRLLLKKDGMGFSFHVTTVDSGADLNMHYTNHLEAVYCISGTGTIEDLDSGETHDIRPGVIYALDKHDRHRVRASTGLTLICVFNPPVVGAETHDEAGSYPLETA